MKRYSLIISLFVILPFISWVKAQTAQDKITDWTNQSDFLAINHHYPALKDSIIPSQQAFMEALLDVTFNRPEEALKSIEYLLANYQQDIGFSNSINMAAVMSQQLTLLNRYGESADMLKDMLDQLAGAGIPSEVLAPHNKLYKMNEALRYFPKTELIRPKGDCEVSMKIQEVGKEGTLMFVPITINGKEKQCVFDTGADTQAFVSERFARENGIRIISDSLLITGGITSAETQVGVADSIRIGDIIYRNVRFIVGLDNPIKAAGIIDTPDSVKYILDCVLGKEFMLDTGEIQIFPKQNKIVFPEKLTPPPSFAPNMMSNMGQPYVEAYSNNERLIFHLDTGNTSSDLSYAYYMNHKNEIEATGKKENIGYGGFGGAKMIDVYKLPLLPLQVGDTKFEIKNMMVQAENLNIISQDGVLGMSFINLFDKVTINFKDMFIAVE